MLARLTMIASGATPGMRKGRFPNDEALAPLAQERARALAASLRRAAACRAGFRPLGRPELRGGSGRGSR